MEQYRISFAYILYRVDGEQALADLRFGSGGERLSEEILPPVGGIWHSRVDSNGAVWMDSPGRRIVRIGLSANNV